jgi:hypothetical protein
MPIVGKDEPSERIARALEHIAVVLSAIDHNIEVLLNRTSRGS